MNDALCVSKRGGARGVYNVGKSTNINKPKKKGQKRSDSVVGEGQDATSSSVYSGRTEEGEVRSFFTLVKK